MLCSTRSTAALGEGAHACGAQAVDASGSGLRSGRPRGREQGWWVVAWTFLTAVMTTMRLEHILR